MSCAQLSAAFHSSAVPHSSTEKAFPTDGPKTSDRSTSAQLSQTEESRGEVLLQKSPSAKRVCFFWLCAVKLHGGGERRRLWDLLQPAPVNQSQPIKGLVGFISSRSHLWLKPAEAEAVTPAGRTYQGGNSSRTAFFFLVLSGAQRDAGCGVGT